MYSRLALLNRLQHASFNCLPIMFLAGHAVNYSLQSHRQLMSKEWGSSAANDAAAAQIRHHPVWQLQFALKHGFGGLAQALTRPTEHAWHAR